MFLIDKNILGKLNSLVWYMISVGSIWLDLCVLVQLSFCILVCGMNAWLMWSTDMNCWHCGYDCISMVSPHQLYNVEPLGQLGLKQSKILEAPGGSGRFDMLLFCWLFFVTMCVVVIWWKIQFEWFCNGCNLVNYGFTHNK